MRKRRLRILMSSGPTREPIDPVRFLSNYSTGYMGARLAAEAIHRGHQVTVVSGPASEPLPPGARVIAIQETREMEAAMARLAKRADVLIMAAAVSDFRPVQLRSKKLPRRSRLTVTLEATPDIVARLPRRDRQLVVGFALETDHVLARAKRKLRLKRLALLLAQRVNGTGSPFGRSPVEAWLLGLGQPVIRLGRISKAQIARVLLDKVEGLWYGQQGFRHT